MYDVHIKLLVLLCLLFQFKILYCNAQNADFFSLYDILEPYKNFFNRHNNPRMKRDVTTNKSGLYEVYFSHNSSNLFPVSSTKYFVSNVPKHPDYYWEKITAYGHVTIINNPFHTFSIIEPNGSGGCQNNTREFVEETAKIKQCYVAQNGGYFNTTSGCCFGNLIVDEVLIQNNGGVINAHFGILKNSSIVVGYIPESFIQSNQFRHLIGGVGWLVKNGSSFVEKSIEFESDDFEETGTYEYFANVQSARTAIGHNIHGQIVLVNVEGQTGARGLNLYQMAYLLVKEFNLVNAINLDGGGSATLVLNGSVANYPSDHCKDNPQWRCPRKVSSVVCVHDPRCLIDCINGKCVNGMCQCNDNYIGDVCNVLRCGHHNCSSHGTCFASGCNCDPGWVGSDCNIPCSVNFFGKHCTQKCTCKNNATCDGVSGKCDCLPGFTGDNCDSKCIDGLYGKNCEFDCNCPNTCSCDPINGICTNTPRLNTSLTWGAALCYRNISQLVQMVVKPTEFEWAYVGSLGYIFLCASIVFNIILLWKLYRITDGYTHNIAELSSTSVGVEYETITGNKVSNDAIKNNWKDKWLNKIEDYRMKTRYNGYMPLNKTNNNIEETALLS